MKLGPQQVAGLEWAVNEITDNVITHANSRVGGFLICNKISDNILEFTVADAGIGILRSLGGDTDQEALERAIQEGVTRNTKTNQGNGLYGTYRLALVSSGIFVLRSGHGNLFVTKDGGMHIKSDNVLYQGTYVVCQVDLSRPDLVERALVIGGRSHTIGFDYIERVHETEGGELRVSANEICKTFGSRQSGFEARRYLENLLEMQSGVSVIIDFDDIHVISSSFADEVFGKLFLGLGPMNYMRRIKLINTASTIDGLIDRAITLRSRTGL
jgi:anti-sigma regulatory factor (Ser/Thr protein kinase)